MKINIPLSLGAAAALAFATHASAAPRFVLRIVDHDGTTLIEGAAKEPHVDWINVLAFGTRAHQLESPDGSRIGAGCEQQGFTFHKPSDKSTPLLQKALFSGQLLPAVQIKYLGADGSAGNGSEPILVELRHVQVTAFHMHGKFSDAAGDPVPTEEVTLDFSESSYIYRERNDEGEVIDETETILSYFLATEDPAFDDDNDGLTNDLDNDDDNDGISDENEVSGGSNPLLHDADEDLDGDGDSNAKEVIAGTHMGDATDFLGIEHITHRQTPEGLQLTVSFPVTGGRHYRLLAAMDPRIPDDAWLTLDEFDVPEGDPRRGADIELNPNILQNAPSLYFRVEVNLLAEPLPVDPNPGGPLPPHPIPGEPVPAPTPIP